MGVWRVVCRWGVGGGGEAGIMNGSYSLTKR